MGLSELIGGVRELQLIIDVIPSPVFVKDRRHRLILVNSAACEMFGHSREVLLENDDEDLFPLEQVKIFREMDDRVFSTGESTENEEAVTDASGTVRTIVTRKRLIRLNDGTDLLVAAATDVTAFREAEAHSRHLAFHDPLTGLPNRALMNERLDHRLARRRRDLGDYALLYIDLDRFKDVNDTYGHQAGDDLIRVFSGRLSAIIRASDTVARMGGDEFAVLLADTASPEEVEQICSRILEAASRPFEVGGSFAFVGASIGVVHAPGAEIGRVELQRRADVALYRAKAEGRNCFHLFTDALDETLKHRRRVEADLREALQHDRGLEVYYQPLVSADGGRPVAMEALVRWRHDTLGMLLPTQFIPVAEETGLILPLGDWVLDRACRAIAAWGDLDLAVNLSSVQLRDADLVERVTRIASRAGFPLSRLQLEITESSILEASETVGETLRALRALGVKIALDDFGTGYSSLAHLRNFEVDKVKIDRSFVLHLGHVDDSAAIVQAVTSMGKALGLSVVAEGVETAAQRDFLVDLGCEEIQGHLLSRPMAECDLRQYLGVAAEGREKVSA